MFLNSSFKRRDLGKLFLVPAARSQPPAPKPSPWPGLNVAGVLGAPERNTSNKNTLGRREKTPRTIGKQRG